MDQNITIEDRVRVLDAAEAPETVTAFTLIFRNQAEQPDIFADADGHRRVLKPPAPRRDPVWTFCSLREECPDRFLQRGLGYDDNCFWGFFNELARRTALYAHLGRSWDAGGDFPQNVF